MRYFFQIGFAVLALWLLSGCSALVPLGEQGRLGYVALECRYLPPIGNAELETWNAERGESR
jgi:hypothetical protein